MGAVAVALGAFLLAGAADAQFARGYVRMPRSGITEVESVTEEDIRSAPQAWDWSAKGATSEVKNQGSCGSCWAFSTTEGVESAIFMQTGQMPVLSTQQIISCDETDGGCNGGDPATALKYIEQAGGLDTAADYEDTSHSSGSTGSCKWDKQTAATVTGWRYAIPLCDSGKCENQSEDALAAALAKNGPLSICVNAAHWDFYRGGVFSCGIFDWKCSGHASALDHCVQLVGYDKSGSSPYWKVRNSWGTSWGENGFIRLPYGKNACGVADEAYIINATLVDSLTV